MKLEAAAVPRPPLPIPGTLAPQTIGNVVKVLATVDSETAVHNTRNVLSLTVVDTAGTETGSQEPECTRTHRRTLPGKPRALSSIFNDRPFQLSVTTYSEALRSFTPVTFRTESLTRLYG